MAAAADNDKGCLESFGKMLLKEEGGKYRKFTYSLDSTLDLSIPSELRARVAQFLFKLMSDLFKSSFIPKPPGYVDSTWTVLNVEYLENEVLEKSFEAKRAEFVSKEIPAEKLLLFHGTKAENAEEIFKGNFDPNKCVRFAYGRGIYFSEFPEVSLGYGDCLILCRVLPGRVQTDRMRFIPSLYDSFHAFSTEYGGGGIDDSKLKCAQIHVVNNPGQILPFCSFELKKSVPAPADSVTTATILATGGISAAMDDTPSSWLSSAAAASVISRLLKHLMTTKVVMESEQARREICDCLDWHQRLVADPNHLPEQVKILRNKLEDLLEMTTRMEMAAASNCWPVDDDGQFCLDNDNEDDVYDINEEEEDVGPED